MALAPPKAAPAHAAVVRSMLVQGSRLAIMRSEVTAVMCMAAGAAPEASAMRAMMTTRSAHLGGIEEQIGVDRHGEGALRNSVAGADAGSLERAQVGNERRREKGQLLRLARAGLVRNRRVDQDRREARAALARLEGELCGFGKGCVQRGPERAKARERAEGIDVELRGNGAGLALEPAQRCKEMARGIEAFHAAREGNRRVVEMHACKRGGHVGGASDGDAGLTRSGDLQHDAIGAAFQLLEDRFVGCGRDRLR